MYVGEVIIWIGVIFLLAIGVRALFGSSEEIPKDYIQAKILNKTVETHMVGKVTETDLIITTNKGRYEVDSKTYDELACYQVYNFTLQQGSITEFVWVSN